MEPSGMDADERQLDDYDDLIEKIDRLNNMDFEELPSANLTDAEQRTRYDAAAADREDRCSIVDKDFERLLEKEPMLLDPRLLQAPSSAPPRIASYGLNELLVPPPQYLGTSTPTFPVGDYPTQADVRRPQAFGQTSVIRCSGANRLAQSKARMPPLPNHQHHRATQLFQSQQRKIVNPAQLQSNARQSHLQQQQQQQQNFPSLLGGASPLSHFPSVNVSLQRPSPDNSVQPLALDDELLERAHATDNSVDNTGFYRNILVCQIDEPDASEQRTSRSYSLPYALSPTRNQDHRLQRLSPMESISEQPCTQFQRKDNEIRNNASPQLFSSVQNDDAESGYDKCREYFGAIVSAKPLPSRYVFRCRGKEHSSINAVHIL